MIISTWDYGIFIVVNVLNIITGIYFGYYETNKSTDDYLVGARQMKPIPIGISMLLSGISGITILGLPTEIYLHGMQLLYCCFAYVLSSVVVGLLYVPILHKLNITSIFEYLERRFDKRLRTIVSGISIIQLLCFLPIAIYVPTMAINYLTQIDIHVISPIFFLICIFYTTLGGFRAVVWSDFLQAFILFPSIIIIAAKGTYDLGINKIIEDSIATDRLELPIFDLDLTIKYSLWPLFVGGSFYYTQTVFLHQVVIQKYQSLPTLKDVRIAMFVCLLGALIITLGCGYNGLLVHSFFYGCDPVKSQTMKIYDQLLPSLVANLFHHSPGLCGLFITGLSSAGLSSLASGINSLSALVLEDFYKSFVTTQLSERKSVIILRTLSLIFGTCIFLLVFIVEFFSSSVYDLCYSIDSIFGGVALGLLSIGLFLPWINAKAASIGSIIGLCTVAWISGASKYYQKFSTSKLESRALSIENCTGNFSVLYYDINESTDESIFFLYRISFFWYAMIGCVVTITVSLLTSLCLGWNDLSQIDPELFSPYLQRYVPKGSAKEKINHPTKQAEIDKLLNDENKYT